jgi:hypothetical protein
MSTRGAAQLKKIIMRDPGVFVVTISTEEGGDEDFLFRESGGALSAVEADSEFARRFGPYAMGAAIYAAVNSFRKAAKLNMAGLRA